MSVQQIGIVTLERANKDKKGLGTLGLSVSKAGEDLVINGIEPEVNIHLRSNILDWNKWVIKRSR